MCFVHENALIDEEIEVSPEDEMEVFEKFIK